MNKLIEQFQRANTPDQLSSALANFFAQEGIKSLAITYYQRHTKSGYPLLYDWVSPALKPWHDYYLSQNYADVDRTLESTEQSSIPIWWDVNLQLQAAKSSREKMIRIESIEFGIDKGLCIPVHSPNGDILNIVLHQRCQEACLENWQEKQFSWMGLAQYYHHFLKKVFLPQQVKLDHLTEREKECLALTAEGMRIAAIARELNIKVRTVNFHLQNANKKLGVSNKYLAVLTWKAGR